MSGKLRCTHEAVEQPRIAVADLMLLIGRAGSAEAERELRRAVRFDEVLFGHHHRFDRSISSAQSLPITFNEFDATA